MKTITLIYTSEFQSIAKKIENYLLQEEFLLFKFKLEVETIDLVWTNFKSSLSVSDLIIPILFPIQKTNETYSDLRHFFSVAGDFEKEQLKACLPIYLTSTELRADLKKGLIRYPQQFFSNTFSLNWNDFLADEENLQIFKTKLAALIRLEQRASPNVSNATNTPKKKVGEIINFISKNKLKQAFNAAKELIGLILDGKQYQNNLILVESQFNAYLGMEIAGTHNQMELILEKNKITSSLLSLVEMIDNP